MASLIDQLSDLAADVIKDARAEAKPILKEGKRLAAGQAKAHAKLAKAESKAAAESAAKAGKAPKKKHRLRKLLTLVLLGAGATALARKLTADEQEWQSAD